MSLANKYRPQTFDTTIGQKHITPILKANMQQASSQSNFLLYGPRGTGKTTSARLIAKALNCLSLQDGNPCNECEHCRAINENNTMDIIEIDAASHTGVDNIREEIIEKAYYRPSMLNTKVYIIDEVHMLSKGAFNALLKIMEEPQSYLRFILATTEIHKVPDTIISRCQVFQFKRIAIDDIVQHLQNITTKEGLTADTDGLSLIAKVSDGCMRDAIKYLDQMSVLGNIDEPTVSKFLGVVGEAVIQRFLTTLQQYYQTHTQQTNDTDAFTPLHELLNELQYNGTDVVQFGKDVLRYIDEHFLEDVKFYARAGEKIQNLLGNIKYYPHPILAWKVGLILDQGKN